MTLDLSAIKTRLEAATPGPWIYGSWSGQCHLNHHPHGQGECIYTYTLQDESCVSLPKENRELIGWNAYRTILNKQDAQFIANAPTDIANLIAEIERLQAKQDVAVSTLVTIKDALKALVPNMLPELIKFIEVRLDKIEKL